MKPGCSEKFFRTAKSACGEWDSRSKNQKPKSYPLLGFRESELVVSDYLSQ
jgi:predicted acetyltransferase